jgi:hypothetical protein
MGIMINLAGKRRWERVRLRGSTKYTGVGFKKIIASRTELFNGKVNIVTAPDKGCKLNIHVPISKI